MQFSPTGLTTRPHITAQQEGPTESSVHTASESRGPYCPARINRTGPSSLPFPTHSSKHNGASRSKSRGQEKRSIPTKASTTHQGKLGREGGSNLKIDRTMEEGRRGLSRGVGVLKVVVAHGTNLAIRDFTSSDPYVVVRLADMSAKTKVINSCLNPVWNEEMTFSIKEPVGVIKFEVFDWDRFKYDDKMGHAFLDLQPVAAAMKLRRALQLTTGETKLRKVAPSTDNCLLSDSFVMYADGEVVLDARLRLRNVESGELFVTIKWIEADAK